jgi:uncharacterized protein (DUF697 family)
MTEQVLIPANEADVRVARAMEIVKRNMLWSAAAGVVPIPMLELVAITGIEVKLVKELADHYGVSFRRDLAKTAVLSLVGSLGSVALGKMIALSSMRAIPFLGQLVAAVSVPGMAAAITYAIGRVFVSHFEAGGTLLDFDPAETREFFRTEFANGVKQAATNVTSSPAKPAAA